MLKNWVTETMILHIGNKLLPSFNYMLKNWVTETLCLFHLLLRSFLFQLYVKELSNWNNENNTEAYIHSGFNYMLKNWVTETLFSLTNNHCDNMFQLYVKELSNWNVSSPSPQKVKNSTPMV